MASRPPSKRQQKIALIQGEVGHDGKAKGLVRPSQNGGIEYRESPSDSWGK